MPAGWVLPALLVLAAIFVGILIGLLLGRRPRVPGDAVSISRKALPGDDSEAGRLLRNFLGVMNGEGDDAQAAYEAALKALRERAEAVVDELARASRAIDPHDYPTRWALVHTAAELRHPAALSFLMNLVQTPIPPEESSDIHSFSTVAEETILRTTAVEGVEYLAVAGHPSALEALFGFLQVPSLSIRRAAVQAILATRDGQNLRARVAALLPEDQRYLLDIKRVDVRQAPQIPDPQRYLAPGGVRAESTPAPHLPGESPPPSSRRGGTDAPKVG